MNDVDELRREGTENPSGRGDDYHWLLQCDNAPLLRVDVTITPAQFCFILLYLLVVTTYNTLNKIYTPLISILKSYYYIFYVLYDKFTVNYSIQFGEGLPIQMLVNPRFLNFYVFFNLSKITHYNIRFKMWILIFSLYTLFIQRVNFYFYDFYINVFFFIFHSWTT